MGGGKLKCAGNVRRGSKINFILERTQDTNKYKKLLKYYEETLYLTTYLIKLSYKK